MPTPSDRWTSKPSTRQHILDPGALRGHGDRAVHARGVAATRRTGHRPGEPSGIAGGHHERVIGHEVCARAVGEEAAIPVEHIVLAEAQRRPRQHAPGLVRVACAGRAPLAARVRIGRRQRPIGRAGEAPCDRHELGQCGCRGVEGAVRQLPGCDLDPAAGHCSGHRDQYRDDDEDDDDLYQREA
jgi:hypothetical protein